MTNLVNPLFFFVVQHQNLTLISLIILQIKNADYTRIFLIFLLNMQCVV